MSIQDNKNLDKNFSDELNSLVQLQHKITDSEFNSMARGLLLKAVNVISRLKADLEDKNSIIKKYDEERKDFLNKLNNAVAGETKAYERLADLDITRHAEIADLRQEISNLENENQHLLKMVIELEDFKKAQSTKENSIELKQKDLSTALSNLRELELKYKELEKKYRNAEIELNQFREKLISDGLEDHETQSGTLEEIDTLKSEIIKLKNEIENKTTFLEVKEKEIELFNTQLSELKREILSITQERNSLKAEFKTLPDKLRRENEGYLNKISQLEAEVKRLAAEKDEETTRCNLELKTADVEINVLKIELENKKNALIQKSSELENVSREQKQMRIRLDHANELLSEKEKEIVELRENNLKLTSMLLELEKKSMQPEEIPSSSINNTDIIQKPSEPVFAPDQETIKSYVYKSKGLSFSKITVLFAILFTIMAVLGVFFLKDKLSLIVRQFFP